MSVLYYYYFIFLILATLSKTEVNMLYRNAKSYQGSDFTITVATVSR